MCVCVSGSSKRWCSENLKILTGPKTDPGGALHPPVEMSQALSTSAGTLTPLCARVSEAFSHGTSRVLIRYPFCSFRT